MPGEDIKTLILNQPPWSFARWSNNWYESLHLSYVWSNLKVVMKFGKSNSWTCSGMASYHQAISTRTPLGVDLCITNTHPVPLGLPSHTWFFDLEQMWKFEVDKMASCEKQMQKSLDKFDITHTVMKETPKRLLLPLKGLEHHRSLNLAQYFRIKESLHPVTKRITSKSLLLNLIARGQMLRLRYVASRVSSPMFFQIA